MLKEVVLAASALTLTSGCSLFEGGDDKAATPTASANEEQDDTPVLLTGRFIDSPVEGLRYVVQKKLYKDNPQSSTEVTSSGVTNEDGEYFYEEDDDYILFYIGNIFITGGPVGQIFTPLNVAYIKGPFQVNELDEDEQQFLHSHASINRARLLQTLDSDGYPDNGITITEETANEFSSKFNSVYDSNMFFQFTEDFASDLEEHIGEYTNTSALVSAESAINHMSASLSEIESDYAINLVGQTWQTQLKELRQYVSFDDRETWGEPTICTETDMTIYSIEDFYDSHVDVEIWDSYNATTCTRTGEASSETAYYGRHTMCPSSECKYSDLNYISDWRQDLPYGRSEKSTRFHLEGSEKITTIQEIRFTYDDQDYWQVARYESERIH